MAAALVIMTGPPGTGKSTIARAIADRLGAAVLPIDSIEVALNRMGITRDVGEGSYQAAYEVIGALVACELSAGRPVVADATYAASGDRDGLRQVAATHQAPAVVIATVCSDRALHRERLQGRGDRPGLDGFLYPAEWRRVEQRMEGYEVPAEATLLLDAADSLDANIERALAAVTGARHRAP